MAVSRIVIKSESIDQNSFSINIPNSTSVYHFRADLDAGVYSVTCSPSIVAVVDFTRNSSNYRATTSSGSANINVLNAIDTISIKINSGTNQIVSIKQVSTLTSGTEHISATGTLITTSGQYNSTGFHYYYLVGGGGAGGSQRFKFNGNALPGGGSGYLSQGYIMINSPINVTVGAGGGPGGPSSTNPTTPGGASSLVLSDRTINASGGLSGNEGGAGGSPGGAAGAAPGLPSSSGNVSSDWDTRYYDPPRNAGVGKPWSWPAPTEPSMTGGVYGGGAGGLTAPAPNNNLNNQGGGGGGMVPGGGPVGQFGGSGGAYLVKIDIP